MIYERAMVAKFRQNRMEPDTLATLSNGTLLVSAPQVPEPSL